MRGEITTRPRRRLRLRLRSTLAFGLSALVLSTCFAALGYVLVRRSLIDEREDQALRQAFLNARVMRNSLRVSDPDVPRLLQGLQVSSPGGALLRVGGEWYGTSVDLTRAALPADLVAAAERGRAGRQTVRFKNEPFIATGVPISEHDAAYFELDSVGEVEDTLELLARSLVVAGIAATIVGGAVGASTSGAVLRPVRRMAGVARRIVDGDLESRLDADGDPDLEPLVSSFNEMLDDLRTRIQREARFASDVTHELRGPLATLASAVEVVNRRRDELPARAVDAVDALAAQVASFNQLVLDLLEISRFDAGAAQLEARILELRELVERIVRDTGATATIEAVHPGPYLVNGDPRRLQQMIVNLLQNAERYAGGATRVALERDDHAVRVAVEDRGPGVPVEERDLIFGRFARGAVAHGPDAPRGTGLGLALVAEHAALHGGRVWVEDATPRGARFVIELPAGGR